ncbi:MAG: glycosyltransferase family 2 protein [Rhodothermaceae bacterium]|nr:glycosyltransferase family 2 protein [Rhodothermaceae bacterium]
MLVLALLLATHGVLLAITAVNLVTLHRRGQDRTALGAYPTLSVLIPARNEEDNLRRLLPSLLTQDYPNVEVIVVDDASEDGTAAVLSAHADPHLRVLSGEGPPSGWLGKPHACYQAAEAATGEAFLFLDADAELTDPGALRRLVERFAACGANAVLTGLPRYTGTGGGLLLTSLVPFALLTALPLSLVPRMASPALSALNGQCWMIRAEAYRRYAPHQVVKAEVLEDVKIGRLLKRHGMHLHLRDLGGEVRVEMYRSFGEAWRGFRKNAYLLQGGSLLRFLPLHALFWMLYVVAPFVGWPLLGTTYLLKGLADRAARFPLWVTLLTPLVLLCGALIQLDSAFAHATGRVAWKGRRV